LAAEEEEDEEEEEEEEQEDWDWEHASEEREETPKRSLKRSLTGLSCRLVPPSPVALSLSVVE